MADLFCRIQGRGSRREDDTLRRRQLLDDTNQGGLSDQILGMRLMRTKGRRRAVVAIVLKLAVLLHRMWVDGTEFRSGTVASIA